MTETTIIAKMAEKVSKEIFRVFKWERKRSKDRNWNCAIPEIHKTHAGTHPSDVVYFYRHPYLGEDVYINTDLKSYAKDSIKKPSITNAITSLAKATHCANHSDSFEKKYIHTDEQYDVVGMLFIYNHCGNYDSDFNTILNSVKQEELQLEHTNKLFILSPTKVQKLCDISTDIRLLIGDLELPQPENYSFLYPDLVLTKNRLSDNESATLETLLSDVIIIKHDYDDHNDIKAGFVVYYSKKNPTIDDFIYLLDSLSHYQMLDKNRKIRIRYTHKEQKEDDFANVFECALTKYAAIWGKKKESLDKKISFEIITTFSKKYSESVLGME